MRKNKGFTLIELLVVIAIIGILAAIVLVSLSGAQNRARDARITADLNQMRTAATIYNNDTSNYNGFDKETNIVSLVSDLVASSGGNSKEFFIATSATDYCAVAKLSTNSYWCIDSLNITSKSYTADPTVCTTASPKCE